MCMNSANRPIQLNHRGEHFEHFEHSNNWKSGELGYVNQCSYVNVYKKSNWIKQVNILNPPTPVTWIYAFL